MRGHLLHEVAAQLQQLIDAQLSPRVAFDDPTARNLDPGSDVDSGSAADAGPDADAPLLSTSAEF